MNTPIHNSAFFSLINKIVSEKIPFNKLLGMTVDSIEDDTIKIKIKMKDEFVGNYIKKNLHGGVISSLIDVTGGMAAFVSFYKKNTEQSIEAQKKKFSRLGTVDLRVDYLRPGYGNWFIASGYTLRAGTRVAVTRIELNNDAGKLIASGTGTYIL
ncbi:MAG: thioesterase family protein [Deltaproteobacteria bacterium]|nr:thioesterase family protein [Deltaproteobacteria bacterium]